MEARDGDEMGEARPREELVDAEGLEALAIAQGGTGHERPAGIVLGPYGLEQRRADAVQKARDPPCGLDLGIAQELHRAGNGPLPGRESEIIVLEGLESAHAADGVAPRREDRR